MKRRAQVLSIAFLLGAAMIYVYGQPQPSYQGQSRTQPQQQQAPTQQPGQTYPGQQPGESYPGQQPPGQPGTQAPDSQSSASQGEQAFKGTIVKSGGKYVFQDDATGKTYDIDHQDLVAQHVGKKVRVKGTLDPSGKMIHIGPANQ